MSKLMTCHILLQFLPSENEQSIYNHAYRNGSFESKRLVQKEEIRILKIVYALYFIWQYYIAPCCTKYV